LIQPQLIFHSFSLLPFRLAGQLPKRITIAFVSSKAANGSYHHNPFDFAHYNLIEIGVSSDAHNNILPLKMDFDKNSFMQPYQALFEATGVFFKDAGNNISRAMYNKGFSIFCFDLSEDLAGSESHLSLPRQGSLRIALQFGKPLTENINMIVLSEFDSVVEIDKSRNCVLDYAS
jgi:hypothetical protein